MLQQNTRNIKNDSKLKQNYPWVLYDNIFLFGNTHYSKSLEWLFRISFLCTCFPTVPTESIKTCRLHWYFRIMFIFAEKSWTENLRSLLSYCNKNTEYSYVYLFSNTHRQGCLSSNLGKCNPKNKWLWRKNSDHIDGLLTC